MKTTTISQANKDFLEHLKEIGKSERTIYTYRKDLEIVEGYFTPERHIAEIRALQIGKLFKSDAMLKKPNGDMRADRTVEKTIRVFRMMLVWAKDQGIIDELPLPKSTPMGNSMKVATTEAPETTAEETLTDA